MLIEESNWIGDKIKVVVEQQAFPILNIGSSTKEYRTIRQGFIQKNIFDLVPDEAKNVVHLDMKAAEGVDIVGNLYDKDFLEELKKYKFKSIMINNLLMYLEREQREELSLIIDEILEKDGFLIVTNSHTFPPAHDPVESFYRPAPDKMQHQLFNKFTVIDSQVVSTNYNFHKYLKTNKKVIPVKVARFLMPFYKFREWKFMLNYYLNDFKRDYSAACLFVQKK
ncbi:hypothetical protein [Soonwooa sp.]|uniref:hypothetical protein n=1 Tax=Soonwooa sp. TaxID=1938592 RepID=UPI0026160578|nr:hypothetical protein [Soonwooa sp.]